MSARHPEICLLSPDSRGGANIEFDKDIELAAVQMAPVFLDKESTTQKVCTVIEEAAKHGSTLIGFPESIIPEYPGQIEMLPLD